MKIDPYKNKETWLAWKEKVKNGIPGISKENSNLIINYLRDMETGINISTDSKKGTEAAFLEAAADVVIEYEDLVELGEQLGKIR